MDNRRKYERFEAVGFLIYKPHLFSARVDTITKNMSLKGACFFSEKKIKIGRIITLKLHYGVKVSSKIIKAKVVYSCPVKDKLGSGYFNGAEFIE